MGRQLLAMVGLGAEGLAVGEVEQQQQHWKLLPPLPLHDSVCALAVDQKMPDLPES